MSSSLVWREVSPRNQGLPDSLKYALRKKYGNPVSSILSNQDIDYLSGLRDAGVEGADELITIILDVGEVEVTESY